MKLSCLIVDDEPSGRKVIEEYISEVTFLELGGKAENPVRALELMQQKSFDVIFLDIEMPKINGIDLLKNLVEPPLVILTTAFPQYALEGFELDVIDYLLKPISLMRFLKAANKAKDFFEGRNKKRASIDYFFIKSSNMFEKVNYSDLLYVEAANNYVILQTKDKRMITYLTFKGIEEQLPAELFIKVHKSFIVSLHEINAFDNEEIKIGDYIIPISRNFKNDVQDRIFNNRLLKR